MAKRFLALSLLLLLSGYAGCAADTEKAGNEAAPAAAGSPVPEPVIIYGQGFSDEEQDGGNTWRWMAGQGFIRLKNSGKEMKLRIKGDAPIEQFTKPPVITVTLNGEKLDEFPGAKDIAKEYIVPVARQGNGPASELRITTDKVFVPKEKDPKSNDERQLGFSLRELVWEPQQ